jgi:AGZA family xanthine/uracil permease-like MFS transporter
MGIIVDNPATLVSLGDISSPNILLGIFGFITAAIFYSYRIKGAFILSILITSIVAWMFHLEALPKGIISFNIAGINDIFLHFDLKSALTLSLIPVIITFLITDMFDSVGTLAGIGMRAGLFKNNSKELQKTLEADAAATVIGAAIGTSTTTSFIESAAGVEEGGRTGLTAVVTGLFFITTLFFLPLYKAIPDNAIYPILVMVGVLMFSELKNIDFTNNVVAVSSFMTIILMPLTYSITIGISAGFVLYLVLALFRKEFDKINIGTITLAVIGLMAFIFH